MKKENHRTKKPEKRQNSHEEGVYQAVRKNGALYFRASLTFRRKHISLGSFSSQDAAHAAYLEGTRLLKNPDITLLQYQDSSPLAFEKWVCLLNFRDNGIYLGTPIYLGQKMFFYYLTPTHILKFDMDDLFYFSSHKIMCRGNRYFVADYGMQVGLSARYGIKNYAVEGRDFRFLNGDPTDFRRENLLICNRYHGVVRTQKNGQHFYTVRIHIRGNYLVGRYNSELEAAIAYNKAIDILHKNGVTKQFSQNYVEGVSPSLYADIYTRLEISPKILAYTPG